MRYRSAHFFFCAVLLAGAASAQIIECTSQDGRREFAQTCPPGTVKKRELAGSSATRANAGQDAVESNKSLNDRELEFQQRRIAREQESEKAEKQEQQNKFRCVQLNRRIEDYEAAGRIYRTDPATGKKIYMEDEQRTALLNQMRNDAKNCR